MTNTLAYDPVGAMHNIYVNTPKVILYAVVACIVVTVLLGLKFARERDAILERLAQLEGNVPSLSDSEDTCNTPSEASPTRGPLMLPSQHLLGTVGMSSPAAGTVSTASPFDVGAMLAQKDTLDYYTRCTHRLTNASIDNANGLHLQHVHHQMHGVSSADADGIATCTHRYAKLLHMYNALL